MWNDDDIFCEGQLSLFAVSEPEKADPPDWLRDALTLPRRVSARWAWDEGVE